MIPALVRGKLSRDQENLEDLLTSNVFGALRYLSYEAGLYRYLEHADDPAFVGSLPEPSKQLSVAYEFWPWLRLDDSVGCEPDVLITFSLDDEVQVRLLIEAKHLSPKSSYADPYSTKVTDQLALQWACLVRRCEQYGGRPLMLYVTGHHGRPSEDIEDGCREILSKLPVVAAKYPLRCAWLSWRHLSRAFAQRTGVIEGDLHALAERMDFRFFDGVHAISPSAYRPWRFDDRRMFFFAGFGVLSGGASSGSVHKTSGKLWRFKQ